MTHPLSAPAHLHLYFLTSPLGFNTISLFSSQIFKIDIFVLRWWFVQSLETPRIPWEITKLFDWRANILNQSERSVRWRTVRLQKAPFPCRRFFKLLPAPAPISSRFLARLYYLARPSKTAMLRRLIHWGLLKTESLDNAILAFWLA